jgi:hypothetical protein
MHAMRRSAGLAAALLFLVPSFGTAQTAHVADRPADLQAAVASEDASDFTEHVQRYVELRDRVATGLPAMTITDDAAQIQRNVRSLAAAIRETRRGAVQGDVFTASTSGEFKTVLAVLMNAGVWAVIMEENPGAFSYDIDGPYPEGQPRATMPAIILAHLPPLPADMQYLFVGSDLILYDVQANTIVDLLPDAIGWAREH